MILWVKTKGEKGEAGFNVDSLAHAVDRFLGHINHWNKIQEERHEKPYTFTAKFEDENGNITPWKDFKKEISFYKSNS